ncbi:MAG: tyrosine--tRNA ligase [Hyphomicrobiaceae bacterium]|nr:MAG: tyrosine--tRNA ligase [Hyphomicrobiaceae bacterium]
MANFNSDFLRTLSERGFIHQCSDPAGLDMLAAKKGIVCYVGYDCTAPSLHIGHLYSGMMLYWLQATGAGKPITLMGGGTTRVGDPSGKDETRRILAIETIDAHKESMKLVFAKILKFGDGRTDAIMVDNAEWLAPLNYIDFLRDVGRHFSVNRMLSMDSAKLRLEREQELSFIEFNYMLLQSYDFVELARRYGCNLQMGGSDQWGNIVMGVDLGRRMGTHQLYALTCPLLTTASGAKMGKTASGAVWLNEEQLSPYDYWQFWRNCEDADVGRFLKLFTKLPMEEIARLEKLASAEINAAKKVLATEATAIVHGRAAADSAAETARRTFEKGEAAEGLPHYTIDVGALREGIGLLKLIVEVGFASSNSEARKAVANNAIAINDVRIADPKRIVSTADLNNGVAKLSFGKKKHILVKSV